LPECFDTAALRTLVDGVPGLPARHLGGEGDGHEMVDLDVFARGEFLHLTGETVWNLRGDRGHGGGWRMRLRKAPGWDDLDAESGGTVKVADVSTDHTPDTGFSVASWSIGS
jgi:hypothetical protein